MTRSARVPRCKPRDTVIVDVKVLPDQLAVEAYNRRDLDAVVIGYDSDLEYYP